MQDEAGDPHRGASKAGRVELGCADRGGAGEKREISLDGSTCAQLDDGGREGAWSAINSISCWGLLTLEHRSRESNLCSQCISEFLFARRWLSFRVLRTRCVYLPGFRSGRVRAQ